MKQSSYKGKSPLPDFVIDAACAGNAEAVERVLQHYNGYINKLCTRTLYDGSGQPHICIDEYMKRRGNQGGISSTQNLLLLLLLLRAKT